jgi:hypothetical protein
MTYKHGLISGIGITVFIFALLLIASRFTPSNSDSGEWGVLILGLVFAMYGAYQHGRWGKTKAEVKAKRKNQRRCIEAELRREG